MLFPQLSVADQGDRGDTWGKRRTRLVPRFVLQVDLRRHVGTFQSLSGGRVGDAAPCCHVKIPNGSVFSNVQRGLFVVFKAPPADRCVACWAALWGQALLFLQLQTNRNNLFIYRSSMCAQKTLTLDVIPKVSSSLPLVWIQLYIKQAVSTDVTARLKVLVVSRVVSFRWTSLVKISFSC